MTTEKDIVHDCGTHWVLRIGKAYQVMTTGNVASWVDSTYAEPSLAVARCKYLAKRAAPVAAP